MVVDAVVGFTSVESWTLAVSVTRLVLVSALLSVLLLRKLSHPLDSLLTSLRVTGTTPSLLRLGKLSLLLALGTTSLRYFWWFHFHFGHARSWL